MKPVREPRWWAWGMAFCPQMRSRRATYARDLLYTALGALFLVLLTEAAVAAVWIPDALIQRWVAPMLSVLTNLLIIYATVSAARRLHDIGLSGAWALLVMVPVLNILAAVLLLCWPGRPESTGYAFYPREKDFWS